MEESPDETANQASGAIGSTFMPLAYTSILKGVVPSLNGWRAVCILLVLLDHNRWAVGGAWWKTAGLGGLGVRFFFIISGFLITTLMLRETRKEGEIDVKAFFRRRCLRIMPVYYTFLLAVLILQLASPFHLSGREWIHALTFTKNYAGDEWTTGHLWSLAVEQQFYLLWPFAFRLLKPNQSPSRALKWLAIPLALGPIFYASSIAFNLETVLGWRSFPINADSLAIGCATAIALWHYGDKVGSFVQNRMHVLLVAGLLLVSLPLLPLPRTLPFPIVLVFPSLQNVGLLILLLVSVGSVICLPLRFLEWRWISFLGVISYSLYIWQSLFCTNPEVLGASPAWWNSSLSWMLAALLAAVASYFLIERPFLSMKKRKSH